MTKKSSLLKTGKESRTKPDSYSSMKLRRNLVEINGYLENKSFTLSEDVRNALVRKAQRIMEILF